MILAGTPRRPRILPVDPPSAIALMPWLDPKRGQPPALLRPLRAADRTGLAAAARSEDIGRYTSIEWPFSEGAAERLIADAHAAWREDAAARFAVVDGGDPTSDEILGTASLLRLYPERQDAEIGYWLGPAGRGRGLARAATEALAAWAFDALGLARVHLLIDLDNDASLAVARRAGFTRIGEEVWRHPSDASKDGPVERWERPSGTA
jgi:RimJ/RimL family protein N-acetyltransferase